MDGKGTPLVVRLTRYVRVAFDKLHRPVKWTKRGVLERDGHRCAYGAHSGNTIDHIVPRAQGGRSTWGNTVASCQPCNARKANRTPVQDLYQANTILDCARPERQLMLDIGPVGDALLHWR